MKRALRRLRRLLPNSGSSTFMGDVQSKEAARRRAESDITEGIGSGLSSIGDISGGLATRTDPGHVGIGTQSPFQIETRAKRERLHELLRARQSSVRGQKAQPGLAQTRFSVGSFV